MNKAAALLRWLDSLLGERSCPIGLWGRRRIGLFLWWRGDLYEYRYGRCLCGAWYARRIPRAAAEMTVDCTGVMDGIESSQAGVRR